MSAALGAFVFLARYLVGELLYSVCSSWSESMEKSCKLKSKQLAPE